MGLLGDSFDDPQTQAVMQLAAGLLGPGSFGQALGRGLSGFQGSQESTAKQKYVGAQTADAMSQVALRNLQALQAQRMFDLQTPFLEEALRRMRAQQGQQPTQATGGQPSLMAGAGSQPSFMSSNQTMGGSAPQPAAQGASQQQVFPGIPDNVAFSTIGAGGFAKLPELIGKYNEPTEISKLLTALGIDPQSPQGQSLLQKAAKKATNIPLQAGRAGAPMYDSDGNVVAMAPKIPDNAIPAVSGGRVTGVAPLPGASDIVQSNAAAAAGGKAQFTPFSGRTATGEPAPVTSVAAALGPPSPQSSSQVTTPAAMDAIRSALPLMVAERDKMPAGPDRDALDRDINRNQNALLAGKPFTTTTTASPKPALYSDPPLGATATANESAKDAVQNYQEMHKFATTSAPRNIGLLQTIQQLADRTMVGPGANKIQFVNGVLNTLGITPGADQAQNYQIMKKNLNMLVGSQRMGAAGGGSDALQNLLEAANPNVAEMNGPAAKEAAEELIAYNRMMMAKDRSMPNPLSVPTQKFQDAETAFGQFADPRLWQLEHAQNDQERARILSLMPPDDRTAIIQKAKQARKLGILQ